MFSEQVKELRSMSDGVEEDEVGSYYGLSLKVALDEAADTIESLSQKLHDVERLVEQLESEYLMCRCKNKEACTYPEPIGCCYDNGIKKAIEIVNRGLGQQAGKE